MPSVGVVPQQFDLRFCPAVLRISCHGSLARQQCDDFNAARAFWFRILLQSICWHVAAANFFHAPLDGDRALSNFCFAQSMCKLLKETENLITAMAGYELAKIEALRANIRRYRRLLATQLTELERNYLERRLAEDRNALLALTSRSAPQTVSADNSHEVRGAVYG